MADMSGKFSGDGWAAGPGDMKLWGLYGAAGLFLVAEGHVLLQHRAAWTNQGDTWGVPGGARERGESAADAALRETFEECGVPAVSVTVRRSLVTAGPFEGDGWTYTTVLADASSRLPVVANEESQELRWVPLAGDAVEQLDLLPAFRAALPGLRDAVAELGL